MKKLLALLLLLAAPAVAQAPMSGRPSLIPWPTSYRADTGRWLPSRGISVGGLIGEEQLFNTTRGILQESFGVPVSRAPLGGAADLTVRITPGADSLRESYRLVVAPTGIAIEATTGAGVFYALQTIRQLAQTPGNGAGRGLPAVIIVDRPRFQWRGLHLDVVRHFYDIEFVKRYIDLMAQQKFNTFHWHLTDDQGWRIQINAYPRLTEVGAWRRQTILEKHFDPFVGDGIPHGGYYTQDQIRDVVAYAAERYVTVVPEIEMPGHAKAALAAYPEFACTPGPFEVGQVWGVEDDVFCPTEATFTFLENVLREVMALFPSRFIHVGGDEVPKVRWRQSSFAQELMRREGLRNENELQSWFIRRMERFLSGQGRRLIGWDEILEGGIAPGATVMSWRGTAGGIEAARHGHDVVMSPGTHVYFDHYQGPREQEPLSIGGYSPLEKVYAFEPVPTELNATEARHILGAQANMWTEYVASTQHVEYMIYPRALALSEVLWSPRETRNWESFTARLPDVLVGLDRERVNYRIPDVLGLESDHLVLGDTALVTLRAPARATIRYTLDGTEPHTASPIYTAPLNLAIARGPITVTARLHLPDGRLGAPRKATWRKAIYVNAGRTNATGLSAGLSYSFATGRADSVAGVARLAVTSRGTVPTVQLRGDEPGDRWGVTLEGWLRVPADGIWDFELTSDDGSALWIGDQKVVDHDGYHAAEGKTGMIPLRAGLHRIRVVMFQGGGGKALGLGWRREGAATFVPVPGSALFQAR